MLRAFVNFLGDQPNLFGRVVDLLRSSTSLLCDEASLFSGFVGLLRDKANLLHPALNQGFVAENGRRKRVSFGFEPHNTGVSGGKNRTFPSHNYHN